MEKNNNDKEERIQHLLFYRKVHKISIVLNIIFFLMLFSYIIFNSMLSKVEFIYKYNDIFLTILILICLIGVGLYIISHKVIVSLFYYFKKNNYSEKDFDWMMNKEDKNNDKEKE